MAKGKVGQSPEKITLRAGIQKQLALGFRPSHGHLKEYAQTTGVTPRTIQNWISDMVAGREPQKRGRKGPTDEKVRLAREHIESVLKINGWDSGEETVMNALKANGQWHQAPVSRQNHEFRRSVVRRVFDHDLPLECQRLRGLKEILG